MKSLAILFVLLSFACLVHAQDVGIGEEYIEPIHFPKFSLTGEYEINRKFHGFADAALRSDIERRFDGTLSFEAGLVKYFNAGGLFGIGINSFSKPIHFRLGLFAKPYIPLGDRFALFARLAAGIAVDLAFSPSAKEYYGSFDANGNFGRVFKGQSYLGLPFGGFGAATLGLEVFPFSRVGFAFEWGIRATLLHNRKNMLFLSKVEEKSGAPDSFNFMLYELPLMLTLHLII